METPRRKVTYRLYPTTKQLEKLEEISSLHRQLYNAALQQRLEAYQRRGVSLSFADQCKELTLLRQECPEYEALNAQSCQVTLKRIDLAFQNFFRRVRKGEKGPGFPRFKSRNRFKGFGFKSHGDGFKLLTEGKHGRVRISGVGAVKMRGKARTWGGCVTAEILKQGDHYYLSATLECQPKRTSGKKSAAFDWGVETFATIADSDGKYPAVENPRFLKKLLKKLKAAQRAVSKKKLKSQNRNKARKKHVRLIRKVANQRKDFAHKVSANFIKSYALLSTEKLQIKAMTASGGAHKRALNREIINTAPAMFISFLKYKAEEAGTKWIEIPTRKVKPSQTCSGCGHKEKKALAERRHRCEQCGLQMHRDQNSARVMLNWALFGNATGRGSSCWGDEALVSSENQETPTLVT